MTVTPQATRPPLRLIDLSAFLADPANFPHAATENLERLRLACRLLFSPDRIDPTTGIDDLDITALAAELADTDPSLDAATLRTYQHSAAAAIHSLRAHHGPPVEHHGTVADLPVILTRARENGARNARTTANDTHAVKRLLRDLPDLADQDVTTLDLEQVARRFAELNPTVKETTVKAYIARLQHAITAYTTPPADEPDEEPEEPAGPARPTAPAPVSAATSSPDIEHVTVPLPGGRAVSLTTPPDLTGEEGAATGALLRLYHPALFAPAPAATPRAAAGPGRWTLLFWPEHAPDTPETAHLTGETFRRALADHIRGRCEQLADHRDDDAIDAWFSTEVFVALALPGHHDARDAATLL